MPRNISAWRIAFGISVFQICPGIRSISSSHWVETVGLEVGVELSNLRLVLASMGEKDPVSGGHRFTRIANHRSARRGAAPRRPKPNDPAPARGSRRSRLVMAVVPLLITPI
jgi:hypothetical protein